MLTRFEWLPLDFTLIRTGVDRALHTVAAFRGRATLRVAAGSSLTAEGVIPRGRPIVSITSWITELAGIVRIDLTGVEGLDANRAAAQHAAFGGAALVRPATAAIAAISPIRAAPVAAGIITIIAAQSANAAHANARCMGGSAATVVTRAAVVQIRRGVDAAAAAFGRLVRRARAAPVRPTDPATVTARLPDLAFIGHAAADPLDARRKLAFRRFLAPVLAAAAVVHIGLELLGGNAVPTAFLRAVGANAAPARGITQPRAATGISRAPTRTPATRMSPATGGRQPPPPHRATGFSAHPAVTIRTSGQSRRIAIRPLVAPISRAGSWSCGGSGRQAGNRPRTRRWIRAQAPTTCDHCSHITLRGVPAHRQSC